MSEYFNPPPGWTGMPSKEWRPATKWTPDPTWPTPPEGWPFWVDQTGRPVATPNGLYPAKPMSTGEKVTGCGCLVVIAFLLFSACGAVVTVIAGDEPPAQVTPTVTVTPTTTVTPTETAPVPTETGPTETVTVTPTTTVEPPPEPTPTPTPTPTSSPQPAPAPAPDPDPNSNSNSDSGSGSGSGSGSAFYANCDAVRAAGAAPIYRGQPGYSGKLDRDNDGVGCET